MTKHDELIIPRGILGDMGVALTRFRCGQIGLIFREKPSQDHGIDGEIEIFLGDRATGRLVSAQIKCGPSYFTEIDDAGFVFRFDAKHYEYWTSHALPVIGVLVDHESEICYWGNITKESVTNTGAGYKVTIPKSQTIIHNFRQQLIDLATPIISESSYQVLGEEDQSTGVARRISRYVRLNASQRPWTRHAIRQLILQMTSDARTSEYYRNEISAETHGLREADVVWIYVYRSESDRNLGAYIARAIWINPNLPAENQPLHWEGEIDAYGVTIDWNDNFEDLIRLVDERRASKAEFVEYTNRVIGAADLFFSQSQYQTLLKISDLNFTEFTESYAEISNQSDDEPFPTHECERLSDRLAELLALLGNSNIYMDRLRICQSDADFVQFQRYINDAQSKLRDVKYELEIIS